MNAELHRRASDLFADACELGPDQQREMLDRVEREDPELAALLRELLDHDSRPDARFDRPVIEIVAPSLATRAAAPAVPAVIGRYRVIERLGTGGMGIVYEAEQDHPRRRVALKVLRRGFVDETMLRRFEHESEVLGWLSHPGIAQIYEAGTSLIDGERQPYFAMELVRGEPLVEFARQRGLSLHEKLDLIARICDAIEHAHRKGVIHRDLKPSNILVDQLGAPKVLDFGVARVTASDLGATTLRTGVGEMIGTLAYMSPEQIRADPSQIDARTDLYALGVVTYELLAGRRPHDVEGKPLHDAARAILVDEPRPLSAFVREARGDVETIVAKCLEKDRERRYGSARELADDLRRWLADEPIRARPASTSYQLIKFARRNRALVGGLAGIFSAVSIGFAVSLRLYFGAEEARAAERDARGVAEDKAAVLRETNDYFLSLIESPTPWTDGADVRVVDVLDRAAPRIASAFPDRPLQRARLLASLGHTYLRLGRWPEARQHMEEALELWRENNGDDVWALADLEQALALALVELGEPGAAQERIESAIASLTETDSPTRKSTFHGTLARVLESTDRFAEAEIEAREAFRILEQSGDLSDSGFEQTTLTRILVKRGKLEEAEAICRALIEAQLAASAEPRANLMSCYHQMAEILQRQGRTEEAITWIERTLAGYRELAGEGHPDLAALIGNLGMLHHQAGRLDKAEPLLRESLARARASPGDTDRLAAMKQCNLALLLRDRGELDEAESLLLDAERMLTEAADPNSLRRAYVSWKLGEVLRDQGRLDASAERIAEALDVHRALLDPTQLEIAYVAMSLGRVHALRGDPSSALEPFELAYEIRSQRQGPIAPDTLASARCLATARSDAGHAGAGLALAEETWSLARRYCADDAAALALHRADYGWCLFRSGRREEAEPLLRQALDELTVALGENDPSTRQQRERLARIAEDTVSRPTR